MIHGKNDPLVLMEGGRDTAEAIPGAELMIIEGMGYDLYTIIQLLGHSSIKTTTIYLHITPARYVDLKSPLDFIEPQKEGQNDDEE